MVADWTDRTRRTARIRARFPRPFSAYRVMRTDHPLTLTVEQAGQVLGVGRSTAYELVRSGDLRCIRLRRRIVVPVAHLAESLGVDRDAVWATLTATDAKLASPPAVVASTDTTARRGRTPASQTPTLF